MTKNEKTALYIVAAIVAAAMIMRKKYDIVQITNDSGGQQLRTRPKIKRVCKRNSTDDDCDSATQQATKRIITQLPCPTDCGDSMNVAGSGSILQSAKPGVIVHTPAKR